MKDVLVGSYIYINVSYLLDFDTADVVSFDTKYLLHGKLLGTPEVS